MNKEGIIRTAIYLACEKMKKTKRKKNLDERMVKKKEHIFPS